MGRGPGGATPSDPKQPTLRVRLLGGFDLCVDGQVVLLESARAESLFAYLLLRRDAPQSRQHVAFLLWPDSTESQARTNLRHVLHKLRRALPDVDRYLDIGRRTLQLRSGAPVWADVVEFEKALAEGRPADAVRAYGGHLLKGNYDDWVLEERERLRQAHLDALEELAAQFERQGRLAEAIVMAERLAREDRLREAIHRRLMRLHASTGDRARALRTYHECATTLERELGAEPSAETRAVYESLFRTAGPAVSRPSPAPVAGPPMVGRTAERDRLTALWHAVEAGAAHLVLVTGEAGIGKSRLVEELQSWCAHRGAVTAEARAYAAEGALPYGLIVTWLRSEGVAPALRRVDEVHLAELARLLPELATDGVAATGSPLGEHDQRQRLFDAVAAVVRAVGSPTLLVADDVQWCDASTLQMLHYLLRADADTQLLIAATARREDADPDHPLIDVVGGLTRLGRFVEVALGRLGRADVAMLAASVLRRPISDTEIDRLVADSEGNPLFLIEALRAEPDRVGAGWAGASAQVQAVLATRLGQLSPTARELVGVAATIGREFTASVLAAASDADMQTLVAGLDELWRRGLVRAQGPDAYDFTHGKIRDAAYAELSPAKARRHHLRIAEAMSALDAPDDALSGQIAAHYEAAGAPPEASEAYLAAADAAQRRYASADAVRLLEHGLAIAETMTPGPRRAGLELRLLTALPAPLVALDGYLSPRVVDVQDRALALAREVGMQPDPPLLRSLAMSSLTRGDFAGARPFGQQLWDRAERDDDDVLRVEAAYALGVAAFWEGHLEEARAHFATAVARCRPEHRAAHLLRYGQDPEAFCTLRLAYSLWLMGRGDEAAALVSAALAVARASGHAFTRTSTTAWAGLLCLDQGDEVGLRAHVDALARDTASHATPAIRRFTTALVGYVDVLDGAVPAGMKRVRQAFDDARAGQPNAPGLVAMHMRILLGAHTSAGDATGGLAAADQALTMGAGAQLWEPEIRRLRAHFLTLLRADRAEVRAELDRAQMVARRQGAAVFQRRIDRSLQIMGGATPNPLRKQRDHEETLFGTLWERTAQDAAPAGDRKGAVDR